ncbi:MAG: glycosyltransferase family 4 protein [Bryobacteraceae bacterium]|nr:glycosyltransferase family 4 protein [Bryobacteraceae bacterium]
MRVLHIDAGRQMRGGQWQALYLACGLRETGVESLLAARAGSPLLQRAREQGLAAHPINWTAVARLSRQADLVHAHDAAAHTLAALVCRAPLVVSRRVAFPLRRGLLSRWKYRRAARYLAVSHFVRGVLIDGGIPPQKIDVVYDGVPPLPASSGGAILAPATDDPAKGSGLVRKAAEIAGLEVRFTSELLRDLHSASLFVYITHSEGLGSAVLAAMGAGVPVIASRVGGLPEVVQEGVTGLLTRNDPQAIAAAMRRLWEDPPLREQMGAEGRRMVHERFSVEALVRGTLDVYRQVLP